MCPIDIQIHKQSNKESLLEGLYEPKHGAANKTVNIGEKWHVILLGQNCEGDASLTLENRFSAIRPHIPIQN